MPNPPSVNLRYSLVPLCLHPTTEDTVDIYSGFNPRRFITTIPVDDLPQWLAENNGREEYLTQVRMETITREETNALAADLLASLGI